MKTKVVTVAGFEYDPHDIGCELPDVVYDEKLISKLDLLFTQKFFAERAIPSIIHYRGKNYGYSKARAITGGPAPYVRRIYFEIKEK